MGDIEQASSSESVATLLYLRTCLLSALLLQFLPESKVTDGRSFQSGEGWHSTTNAVRFWNSSPRMPKETHSRCYASATAYVMMIPPCNNCSAQSKRPTRSRS